MTALGQTQSRDTILRNVFSKINYFIALLSDYFGKNDGQEILRGVYPELSEGLRMTMAAFQKVIFFAEPTSLKTPG